MLHQPVGVRAGVVVRQPQARYHTQVPMRAKVRVQSNGLKSPELIGSLKLGNVWVFVQLNFGLRLPMNQLNKNSNIA